MTDDEYLQHCLTLSEKRASVRGVDKGENDMKTGTLKELNVKPGDIVECVRTQCGLWTRNGQRYNISVKHGDIVAVNTYGEYRQVDMMDISTFRIISRASDTPKTWGEMTDAEKGALLLHEYEKGNFSIQYGHSMTDTWGTKHIHEPYQNDTRYRIKPEPVRDKVTICCNYGGNYFDVTHKITYDLIDGKPDLTSIKIEEV
jgi:co-chaperonin GroES (HSP10)